MHGSPTLTDEEKREMLIDAGNADRAKAFSAARKSSQSGNLDDYLDFLSENLESFGGIPPRPHITEDYRL